jgi:predicted GIY-YIG superfamily endonuclease
MDYVYLIESENQPKQRYVGLTGNMRQRFADHNEGRSSHTNKYRPWRLVAYFAFADGKTAQEFEQYLKSGSGKTFLKRHFLRKAPAPI